MGQQQLLLVVLGVIVVGIAIVTGISMFQAAAVDANRSNIINDLNQLGGFTQSWYKRPTNFAGGDNTFIGFAIPTEMQSNQNGTYTIETAGTATSIVFRATGTETGDNGTSAVSFRCTVTSTSITIVKIN